MCGIAGYWDRKGADKTVVVRMATQLRHRGPDDSGAWLNEAGNLAFGHRRLAVIDLSYAGHQPMTSACGRFTLVYNGEIYNHLELRRELERQGGKYNWRGHSDTETLIVGLGFWGVKTALKKVNGMFAFAFWDRLQNTLILARDRLGEKPLYYGRIGETFLFASELKSLTVHPQWNGEIDRDALTLYMRHNYVPAPWSIYRNVQKLLPAHFVTIRDVGQSISAPSCYWHLADIAAAGMAQKDRSTESLKTELDQLLRDAVRSRMAADVPLGAFLSGGVDSSIVAALMQAQSERPIKTFTIGYSEQTHDESVHARAIAEHLGTDHTEMRVTPNDALAVIPRLPRVWDEPFADSSQIPTLLLSELTRQHVTVSLSGDGGDELFCGYQRYIRGYKYWKLLSRFPGPVRPFLAAVMGNLPAPALQRLACVLPQKFRLLQLLDRLPKIADLLRNSSQLSYYRWLISHWKEPAAVVRGGAEPQTVFDDSYALSKPSRAPEFSDFRQQMMYLDSTTYLPDDILTKVDRASMASSLEARVPLLDHRLVEFSWQVPMSMKYRNGVSKWLLREVLDRYVPRTLSDHPKMGFGVPIEHWLRGPLRDWAEELLQERRLREEGFFVAEPIRKMWLEHVSGKRRWHYYLWDVLMFQAWVKEQ